MYSDDDGDQVSPQNLQSAPNSRRITRQKERERSKRDAESRRRLSGSVGQGGERRASSRRQNTAAKRSGNVEDMGSNKLNASCTKRQLLSVETPKQKRFKALAAKLGSKDLKEFEAFVRTREDAEDEELECDEERASLRDRIVEKRGSVFDDCTEAEDGEGKEPSILDCMDDDVGDVGDVGGMEEWTEGDEDGRYSVKHRQKTTRQVRSIITRPAPVVSGEEERTSDPMRGDGTQGNAEPVLRRPLETLSAGSVVDTALRTSVADENVDGNEPPEPSRQEARRVAARIHTDDSVILNALSAVRRDIEEAARDDLKSIKTSVKEQVSSINLLKEEVTELGSTVSTIATMMFNKNASGNTRVQKEIDRTLCILRAFFTEKLISTVLTKCLICHCEKLIGTGDIVYFEQLGATFLAVINFSVQPNEKKKGKV